MKNSRFVRSQRMPILNAILAIVVVLVVLQLWLLTASTNAYLGGDEKTAIPAAVVSCLCLLLNVGLLRYLYRLDGTAHATKSVVEL